MKHTIEECINEIKKIILENFTQDLNILEPKIQMYLQRVFPSYKIGEGIYAEKGGYNYIPGLINHILFEVLREIRFNSPSFIDLGCGIGVKSAIARNLGYRASGVDINPDYIKIAKAIHNSDINFEVKDIFDVDLSIYDVIYLYYPVFDSFLDKLKDKLMKEIKEEAVILSCGPLSSRILPCSQSNNDFNKIEVKSNNHLCIYSKSEVKRENIARLLKYV